jgi:membrane protease subunit HflC
MSELEAKAQVVASELGIELVDVRVSRIELPEDVSESVYQRMRAERSRTAKDFRARGKETAENIKAQADKKRTVIIAEAYRTSQQEKGSGDAKSTAIYANAYNQDAEFYAFTRSLKAYVNSFKSKSDMLVIDPDSDFFKYFKDIK